MLGIMLMILKIIGIILLGILGLLLVLILLVLFVPVPYHIYVDGDSGKPETFVYRVKIFGVQVLPKKDSSGKERRPRKKRRKETQQHNDQGAETPRIQAEESKKEAPEERYQEPADTQQTSEQTKQKKQRRLKASKSRPKNTSGADIRETLASFYAEFTDEGNRRALRHLLSEIGRILRHFRPRRVLADVCFSLGDPANTGYVTAALSMCPFSYGKDCRIIPDFEAGKWYVQGRLDVRGHGQAVYPAAAGMRLLFDRDVRRVIGKILKKH